MTSFGLFTYSTFDGLTAFQRPSNRRRAGYVNNARMWYVLKIHIPTAITNLFWILTGHPFVCAPSFSSFCNFQSRIFQSYILSTPSWLTEDKVHSGAAVVRQIRLGYDWLG